jgi:hypothetical protein
MMALTTIAMAQLIVLMQTVLVNLGPEGCGVARV